MELPAGSMTIEGGDGRCLVFLPGFLAPPSAYRALLAPVAEAGVTVVVPRFTRPGPRLLTGRVTPAAEAALATELVAARQAVGEQVWLGGHSRGGLVAWLAALDTAPVGLALVDPVSGGGPPWAAPEPLPPHAPSCPTLVVGCGVGGPCAPEARNHRRFAERSPLATHVVVPDCGHADVLSGPTARLGGVTCGHGRDRGAALAAVTSLLAAFLADPSAGTGEGGP